MNEFLGLVDSHLHLLSMEEKGLDPAACLEAFFEAGGRWALDVAVNTAHWERRLAWGADLRVWFTAGIHPSEAAKTSDEELAALVEQSRHPRCLAVGEIGLDWYRGRENEAAQRDLFRRQLRLAAASELPVVVHNREADRELLEDLDSEHWQGLGIQHCFSSNRDFAKQALDRGFYLSFAGNLTYPSASRLRDVAAWMPIDRLLVETDSPYLAPQSVRGKPNQPKNAGLTARCLAEVRQLSLEDLLQATGENFATLMKLTSTGRGQ